MNAQQTNIEVIANNIANINSTSYKRARAEFTDLFYQMDRMQGVANTSGSSPIPEGANLGLGVKSAAIRKLHIQGALTQTGNPYDMAINGRGWFQVLGPNNEVQYTRAGSFNTNANSQLVTTDGYLLDPAITVPQGTVQVTVNQTGQVFAKLDTEVNPRQIGSSISPISPTRPASNRWAAISIARPRRPARRSSGCRAIPATARSTSNISKPRTSTRSRKSPS